MRHKLENYPMRVKLLQAALELYLTGGFTLTTNQMVADKVGCSTGQITNFFHSKENILYEVLRKVLPFHQGTLSGQIGKDASPAVHYCQEIAVELAFCEQLETVRDLYVNSYTLPKTFAFIRDYSYQKSIALFGTRLPRWSEQDFFETEALTMGIVYGALMDRCDPRYPLSVKLTRVLDALLKMYEFQEAERKSVVETILSFDIRQLALDAEAQMRRQVMEAIRNMTPEEEEAPAPRKKTAGAKSRRKKPT